MNAMQSLVSENAQGLRGCVLVIGVGEVEGIGGAVAKRFSQEGLHVYIVGRTGAKLEEVVHHIRGLGGHVSAVVNDLRDEQAINALFEVVMARETRLEAVIYNAAYANVPRRFSTTPASFFEGNWRLTCLAGLTVAKVAARLMMKQGRGTLIFTGATASLRGKPLFAAFASAKAALRSFVLTLAAEVAPHGLHVAHVVIDGVVDGQRGKRAFGGLGALLMRVKGHTGLLQPEHVAHAYWQLHQQSAGAWSHELELRPFKEKF